MYNLPVMKRTVPKLALVFALHCLNKFSLRVVSSLATELAKNEAPEQNQMGQLTKTRQHIMLLRATDKLLKYLCTIVLRIGLGASRRSGAVCQPKHELGKVRQGPT